MHVPRFFIAVGRVLIAGAMTVAGGLAGQPGASADTTMTIPVTSQQDGAWAATPLGTSATDTVGSFGCAITSVTMMLAYDGIATDPGAFNSWLTANAGYAYDDQLMWAAVDSFTGGRIRFQDWLGADLGAIRHELEYGRPVVAEVQLNGNPRFVLITSYTTAGDFQINDPWFGDTMSFAGRYGDPGAGIVSIRTFTPVESPDPRVGGPAR